MSELDYGIRLDTIHEGFDGRTCWVQARAGAIPGDPPSVVLTMQRLELTGSDVFHELHEMRTDDLGAHWSGPTAHAATLGRRREPEGIEVCVCDMNPRWHGASRTLLSTGHTVRYAGRHLMPDPRPREVAWSAYDAGARRWTAWRTLGLPDDPIFFSAGAGSAQRWDESDGTILLPVYAKAASERTYRSLVVRCGFDGRELRYIEHGPGLSVPVERGLYEPSLTKHGGRYYLTLRNDAAGYVAVGEDGLHFESPRKWTFDDGSDLGNYNTQQHWINHSEGLFLAYTRRGLNNDHIPRHRAPLLAARVDTERVCVIRDTERELVPERGARLGNFQITEVSAEETWLTVTEWMQTTPPDPSDWRKCVAHGANNRVYVSRLLWNRPNAWVGAR